MIKTVFRTSVYVLGFVVCLAASAEMYRISADWAAPFYMSMLLVGISISILCKDMLDD